MTDRFQLFDEPKLTFHRGQETDDPRDGLALFSAFGLSDAGHSSIPPNVVIGTNEGIALWSKWVEALNSPAACVDIVRQRPWPPYPGFDVAFGGSWPHPEKCFEIDATSLNEAARKSNKYERAFSVASLYLEPVQEIKKLDDSRH